MTHDMTQIAILAFMVDVDGAATEVLSVLARWHEAGQSHWTGGDEETGGDDAPAPRVAAAFKALHAAHDALLQASAELVMYYMEK